MASETTAVRPPGPSERTGHPMSGPLNSVIMRLTLRAALSRKRALLFALPAILLIGISGLLKATAHGTSWPPGFLGQVGYLILALTALIIGGSVIGGEVEDGSIVHLLATPVSRRTVVLSKYVVAVVLTIAFAAVPEYLAAAIAAGAGSKLALGLLIGALAGSFIYNALFVMLTAVFSPSRALAIGLLYVLLWEGLLATLVGGVALLSAEHYSLAIANGIAHSGGLNANLTTATGIGMGVVVTVAALVLAVNRLSAFSLKGDVT
jgi:ABC-2 type transport system permease protein